MDTESGSCRVYVDGIWDVFHEGHENLFRQAVEKAQELFPGKEVQLIVGVCGTGVAEYKRKTIMDLDERSAAVRGNHLVSQVIQDCPIRLDTNFLHHNGIDLVVHGDDFTEEKRNYYYGDAIAENKYAEVPYTQGVSTSQLIQEAKELGHFIISTDLTLLKKEELINRIRERSWQELNLTPCFSVENPATIV